jgi:hypothetical protein
VAQAVSKKKIRLADIAPAESIMRDIETSIGTFEAGPLSASDLVGVIGMVGVIVAARNIPTEGLEDVKVNREAMTKMITAIPEIGAVVIARGCREPELAATAADLPGGAFFILFDAIYDMTLGSDAAEANFWQAVGRRAKALKAKTKKKA